MALQPALRLHTQSNALHCVPSARPATTEQRADGCCVSVARSATLALLIALSAWHVAAETLTYTLEPLPKTGGIRVEFTWATSGRGGSLMGVSPRWGNITDVPALLGDFVVQGAKAVRREGARWIVEHDRGANFTVRYEIKPPRRTFDWSDTHLPITTHSFFHGMGNAFLLVPESGGDVPREFDVILRWKLPAGWRSACSWGVGRSVGARVAATDVRHSVYLAGELVIEKSEQDGRSVTVAMVDQFGFRAPRFLALAHRVIAAQCEFMGEKSFPEFVITAIPVGAPLPDGNTRASGSGLYHSFALYLAPRSQLNDAVEHLFAHELFHYWNGRLLGAAKPEELVYWWIEGFTDYYALRILHDSRMWGDELFLKWLNRHIRDYYANPAIGESNEVIGRDFWKRRDTAGEMAYQRGLMLAVRWHALARRAGVADGLDALFLAMIQRARQGAFELTNDAIRTVGAERLGRWFAAEFDQYVIGAATIDLPEDALTPAFRGRIARIHEFDLGFDRERSLKSKTAVGVVKGSAAARAGLREGDKLVGWKLHGDPDQKIALDVLRGENTRKISYFPRGESRSVIQFAPAGAKDAAQPADPE